MRGSDVLGELREGPHGEARREDGRGGEADGRTDATTKGKDGTAMSDKGKETAVQVNVGGRYVLDGVVIHGRRLDGYPGEMPPEVVFGKVLDEVEETTLDYERWLAKEPDGLARRRLEAEWEDEAIVQAGIRPVDREEELAARGDYERDMRKDER
jgi:hypothetical protein